MFPITDIDCRNLPEVASAHEILRVPSVSARFGTAPVFWNWAMGAVATFSPPVVSIVLAIVLDVLTILHTKIYDIICDRFRVF